MKLTQTNPMLALVNEYLIDSPAPINLSYFWGFGYLLGYNPLLGVEWETALRVLYAFRNADPGVNYPPSHLEIFLVLREICMGPFEMS